MTGVGLDRLLAEIGRLRGRRYALLAHAASVSAELTPAPLALAAAGAPAPVRLLAPEHGFHGVEQDMVPVEERPDPWTGLPTVSLYGRGEDSLVPAAEVFAGCDLLVVDLQDVGCRYYTYAATAVWAAEAALAAGCQVWVLDRPNPLGGLEVEGNLRRPGFESFVGAFALPVRHGLTLGELVRLEAVRRGWTDGLQVLRMEGWSREMAWGDTGRAWIPPSPNLPTPGAAWVYPGSCLVEATGLSEGRGTTQPFLLTGAPGLDGAALAQRLERLALPGLRFVPALFRPQFQKHAGQVCGGVRWVVTDRRRLRPYRAGVELLRAVAAAQPEVFSWRSEPYEFVADRPAIDLLTGDSALRRAVDQGEELDGWLQSWPRDEAAFAEERREILLYPEDPGR